MNERRSSLLVGTFVVGALLITAVGAIFLAGGGLGQERAKVVMVFDGSLRGLSVGAPIALRGVTIGQVTDIDLILDADHASVTMEVVGEIDPMSMRVEGSVPETLGEELVGRGLRAQLNSQSLLTGLLYVQLDFHPETEGNLVPTMAPYVQIPTIPTELELLRQSLQKIDYLAIAENVDRIARGLDALVNSEDMQALPGSLRQSMDALQVASTRLEETIERSGPTLDDLLAEGQNTLAEINRQLPSLGDRLAGSLDGLDTAIASAAATMDRLEAAAAPDSTPRRQLAQTIQELSLAARALRSLARSLEEHPEALLRGRDREETIQ